jgi:hypothetical protein
MAYVNNKQIDIEQNTSEYAAVGQNPPVQVELDTTGRPQPRGLLFERRFRLYDHIKLPLKALDIIIVTAVVLLFILFFLGAYKR